MGVDMEAKQISNETKYLTIDGKKIEFSEGQTILEASKSGGIYIPTLCFLEGLEGYGACRLCLCKVEGANKFLPACTTPAKEGMVVTTKDHELQEMRREIMKLILSEHPHSCLICESRDECEKYRPSLQKAGRIFGCFSCPNKQECEIREIMEYLNIEDVEHDLYYKNYPLKREDPFIEKDYNICILCGRCVRVCNELRGTGAINFVNRGNDTKVSTVLDLPHIETNCQFCGACVDACPTGALSSKNTKWTTEYSEVKSSICSFCSVGCGFKYYSIHGEIVESIPDETNPINNGQGCVIGRFCAPQFNNGKERLKYPAYKKDDKHIPTNWSTIYEKLVKELNKYSPEEIAVLASPNLTNESAFILNKFAKKVLQTNNIFTPLEENPIRIFYKQLQQQLNLKTYQRSFQSIKDSDVILLFNTDIQVSHPVLFIELNKAKKQGAKIISINLSKYELSIDTQKLLDYDLNLSRKEMLSFIIAFYREFIKNFEVPKSIISNFNEFTTWLASINPHLQENNFNEIILDIINTLKKKREFKGTIIFGLLKTISRDFIQDLLGSLFNVMILSKHKFKILPLWRLGNCEGVHQNIFYDKNKDYKSTSQILNEISEGKIKVLYLTERINNRSLLDKLELVITQDIYSSDDINFADFILPACSFLEETGSYINSESKLQKLSKCAEKKGEAKPDWKILSELACIYNEDMSNIFNYTDENSILQEIKEKNPFITEIAKQTNIQKNFNNQQVLHTFNFERSYVRPYYDVFTQKSFKFRGEPIYKKVDDLRYLIEYRTEKIQTLELDKEIEEEPIKAPFKVILNEEIAPNFFKLVIHAPFIAKKARPSSFIIIMTDEKSERIPLTLTDWDKNKGNITVIYQETGFSTRELSEVRRGEHLYSVVGPLGKEIELENFGTVLLGGGCYGIGAIYPIARKLKELGNRIIVILEARNQLLLYFEEEFENLADEVIYCTSDGSKGLKGKIDTGIKYVLRKGIKIDRCHFIGCTLMEMKASKMTEANGKIPTFVNLNTIMIDGTGMCGGCRVTLEKDGKEFTKFACVDGPTFNGHLVNWERLITRGERLTFSESKIYQTHPCLALENKNNLGESDE
jgi:predicted molibdopterin-dependent oxidoreductase YjgC/NAD(P)H-flavin reductase